MFHSSHLNTAIYILKQYRGGQPFDSFIREYFSQNKKHGSRDRKNITQLCYAYLRLGKALNNESIKDRILVGLFLCSQEPNELLQHLKPEWDSKASADLWDKLILLDPTDKLQFEIPDIFPFQQALSENIDYTPFCTSFLIQPDLYLRLRPGHEYVVRDKLIAANISFKEISHSCLALNNATKVDHVISLNKEAVIQDRNSQRIGELIQQAKNNSHISCWDCCAGSGGKSILAWDLISEINLTVSDTRPSILLNLEKRFREAGIDRYHAFSADISSSSFQAKQAEFDLIIADVPCTGSGTWSRTPEQLCFFEEDAIKKYSNLQMKIVQSVLPALKPGGHLLYITCSVFRQENEKIVQFITKECGLILQKMELLAGYEMKADSLFAALFTASPK